MKKETISAIIFLIVWIVLMVWWGSVKNIKPDLSSDYQDDSQCQDFGEGKGCW